MQKYEMLYILSPELTDEGREAVIKRVEGVVAQEGGAVLKTDKWGMKKLQYPIRFKSEGFYALMTFEGGPTVVKEIKRVVGNMDGILRRLITKTTGEFTVVPEEKAEAEEPEAEEAAETPAEAAAEETAPTEAAEEAPEAPAEAEAAEAPAETTEG